MPMSSFGMEPLLEPEFSKPYQAWKDEPTPLATHAMLTALNPVLDSAMRSYGGKKASPTLRSKAKLLALDALGKYDPMKAKLRTHLMVNLQSLRRAATQEGQIISIPERVGLDLYHLNEAENKLRDKLGRDPSDAELADHTGLSRKRLGYIRMAKPGYAEGSLFNQGEDGGVEQAAPAVQSTNHDAWYDFVYHDLHPIDQLIMEHSLGLHGKPILPKQVIAYKLRLSPGAVSQRAAKIQAQLDKQEDLGVNLF